MKRELALLNLQFTRNILMDILLWYLSIMAGSTKKAKYQHLVCVHVIELSLKGFELRTVTKTRAECYAGQVTSITSMNHDFAMSKIKN